MLDLQQVLPSAVVALIGWLIVRAIRELDKKIDGLVQKMEDTEEKVQALEKSHGITNAILKEKGVIA